MKKRRTQGINRLIRQRIVEIVLVVIFTIISYIVCTDSNLLKSASIAEAYSTGPYAFQMEFYRSAADMDEILKREGTLDRGTLAVRNPNSSKKYVEISLIVYKMSYDELNKLSFLLGERELRSRSFNCDTNETCRLTLIKTGIPAYTNRYYEFEIVSYQENLVFFDYSFEIRDI